MNLVKKSYFSLVLAAVLGASGLSHADSWDYKGQPGGLCRPFFGNSSSNYTSHYFYNYGALDSVSCPVMRDAMYANTSAAPRYAWITVKSNGGVLQCIFQSYTATGNLVGSISRTTTSTSATSLYYSVPQSMHSYGGSYSINCYLPPNSYIFNYHVGEPTDTDDSN
jgi:hypothetical protein